jgi:hypothetical protein
MGSGDSREVPSPTLREGFRGSRKAGPEPRGGEAGRGGGAAQVREATKTAAAAHESVAAAARAGAARLGPFRRTDAARRSR